MYSLAHRSKKTLLGKIMRIFKSLVLSSALIFISFGASAATIGQCELDDVTVTGTPTVNSTACLNYDSMSNSYANEINDDFFADSTSTVWTELTSDQYSYDKSPNTSTDTWELNTKITGSLVIVLKTADYFAAYFFNSLTDILDGTYSEGNVTIKNGDSYQTLAILSIYTADLDLSNLEINADAIPSVPLPAAAWLFGPALLGLMGFRRKLKS